MNRLSCLNRPISSLFNGCNEKTSSAADLQKISRYFWSVEGAIIYNTYIFLCSHLNVPLLGKGLPYNDITYIVL